MGDLTADAYRLACERGDHDACDDMMVEAIRRLRREARSLDKEGSPSDAAAARLAAFLIAEGSLPPFARPDEVRLRRPIGGPSLGALRVAIQKVYVPEGRGISQPCACPCVGRRCRRCSPEIGPGRGYHRIVLVRGAELAVCESCWRALDGVGLFAPSRHQASGCRGSGGRP